VQLNGEAPEPAGEPGSILVQPLVTQKEWPVEGIPANRSFHRGRQVGPGPS
jgi:hypothetical protein